MPVTEFEATERDLAGLYRAYDTGRNVKGVPAEERLAEYALSIDTVATEAGMFVHIDLPFGWLECKMMRERRKWVVDTVVHHSSRYPEHDIVNDAGEDSFSYRFADDYAEVDEPLRSTEGER